MIILQDKKLIETNFTNEQEIEDLTIANSEHFFGPSSVFIPKAKIKTSDGAGTIPDGFAVDLASRTWFIVEAELGHHSVWTHIAPQVTKQLLAAGRAETRQLLAEIIVQMIRNDPQVEEKFEEEGIKQIDIRKVLGEILEKPPIIGIPIDKVTNDLREWAETLKNDVRLWIVRKFTLFGDQRVIAYDIPEEYRPVLDTSDSGQDSKSGIQTYDVALSDLMAAGFLQEHQIITHSYRPRGGKIRSFTGTLLIDGSISVMNQTFTSPSYAALACIQEAGSDRKTVNGWTSWRTKDGKSLSQVRAEYLAKKEEEAQQSSLTDR